MKKVTELLFLVVGNMLSAAAIGMIALPQGISVGGTSGLAKVIVSFLPMPMSVVLWTINLVLFALAFFVLGKEFAMKTVISSIIFPLFLNIAMNIDVLKDLSQDPLLSSILGGFLLGCGSGLILRGNGSSGGFDILAVIANQKWNIPAAIIIGLCDTFVLLLQVNWNHILYSVYGIVMIIVTSVMVNKIVTKENNEVKLMVFSEFENEIKNLLLNQEDCGVSVLKAETGYTGKEMNVIVSVIPYDKVQSCKAAVLGCDPNAFIVLENVQAAYTGKSGLRKPEDMKKSKE